MVDNYFVGYTSKHDTDKSPFIRSRGAKEHLTTNIFRGVIAIDEGFAPLSLVR